MLVNCRPNQSLVNYAADKDVGGPSLPDRDSFPNPAQDFYNRDALLVARELVGREIISTILGTQVSAVITETCAYPGKNDPDTHPYRTPKDCVSPSYSAGSLYIYSVHGHPLLTVATPPFEDGACVLINAVQLRSGESVRGPGKVSNVLGVSTALNGYNILKDNGDLRIDVITPMSLGGIIELSRGKTSKAPQALYRFKLSDE